MFGIFKKQNRLLSVSLENIIVNNVKFTKEFRNTLADTSMLRNKSKYSLIPPLYEIEVMPKFSEYFLKTNKDFKHLFIAVFGRQLTCVIGFVRHWVWTFQEGQTTLVVYVSSRGVKFEYTPQSDIAYINALENWVTQKLLKYIEESNGKTN